MKFSSLVSAHKYRMEKCAFSKTTPTKNKRKRAQASFPSNIFGL